MYDVFCKYLIHRLASLLWLADVTIIFNLEYIELLIWTKQTKNAQAGHFIQDTYIYVVNLRGSEREKALFAQDMQFALLEKDTYKKFNKIV
jgi:hypothetical protein